MCLLNNPEGVEPMYRVQVYSFFYFVFVNLLYMFYILRKSTQISFFAY